MGNYDQMRTDDAALQLAAEAVNGAGLTSFEQVIARAEAIRRERAHRFAPLPIEVTTDESLTCDEMRALVRQFYGELAPGDMTAIMDQFRGDRKHLDAVVNAVKRERDTAYRMAKRQREPLAVAAV